MMPSITVGRAGGDLRRCITPLRVRPARAARRGATAWIGAGWARRAARCGRSADRRPSGPASPSVVPSSSIASDPTLEALIEVSTDVSPHEGTARRPSEHGTDYEYLFLGRSPVTTSASGLSRDTPFLFISCVRMSVNRPSGCVDGRCAWSGVCGSDRGLAAHQGWREKYGVIVFCRCGRICRFRATNPIQHVGGGIATHGVDRLMNGGQAWCTQCGKWNVIDTHDREIIRDTQATQ